MNEQEVLADILWYALERYDKERARLRRERWFQRAILHRDPGENGSIKRGTARLGLARYLASEIIRERPNYERPEPFDDWTDRERALGVHEAVAEVERRNREKFGTPEMLTALESLNERIDERLP